jgi:hypothetical protein
VHIYKGYAHGYDSRRPIDSIVIDQGGNYRAVPEFEDLKWECTTSKSKKICSASMKGTEAKETICGDFFFGRTESYHSCPLIDVTEPVVFSTMCGIDSEILSSYYRKYKISLWCNGHLTETLEMQPGVSSISTKCEVRSGDGRRVYAHQTGLSVRKGVTHTTLSSSNKHYILRYFEDVIGWPAAGTIIGSIIVALGGSCVCIYKWLGKDRVMRMLNRPAVPRSVTRGVDRESVARRVAGLSTTASIPQNPNVTVYNFGPEGRGRIVPRRLALTPP